MQKCSRLLSIDELETGMICANEIKEQKCVLIGQDVTITESLINKLKSIYFCDKIAVYCDESNAIEYSLDINDDIIIENSKIIDDTFNTENVKSKGIKICEQIEKEFNALALDVQRIFENMEHLKASSMDEIRKFAARIQNELEYASYIIKDIVLYGSGSDTIYRHCVNVAALSAILGSWAGLSKKELNLLTYAAVLHDFGKTKIDKEILDKPGPLTDQEFSVVKKHSIIGYDFIKNVKFLDKAVSYGVLMHHEKADGSGYPLGLTSNKIHKFAKIIAIADIFDAVNSDRNYKKSKKPFEALKLIQRESLIKLDYELCSTFLNRVINYYLGENVLLNNGITCKIIQININNIEKPLLYEGNTFINLNHQRDLYIEKLLL
ncbi:MAG: HD-GYP domain-containing protein [Solirubrobacterales bacterium]